LEKHAERVTRHENQARRLAAARLVQLSALEAADAAGDVDAPMSIALLQNNIEEAEYQATMDLPIELTNEEKTEHSNAWRTYRERNTRLETQRGQAFSMIRGQCMQVLLDKMKDDTDWTLASESYDPLTLLRLIEKTILAQTEDQYPYATVYEQECTLYSFTQNSLTNEQWYERFNTKIDVGSAIGVTRQHQVLLETVTAEIGDGKTKFEDLTSDEQEDVRTKAEERYLSYVFLRQRGKQHNKLKIDLQNDFTTGDNRYPKNRQATLHLLDKYSKSAVVSATTSEGTAFTQRGDKGKGTQKPFDKEYWKDKTCYHCNKQGHPATHCRNKKASNGGEKDKNDDDKYCSSKSSSKTNSINKMQKKLKKSFATLETKIQEMEKEDSDMTDSDSNAEEASHF
jgi:hypothetical protein